MDDLVDELTRWRRGGVRAALARVVDLDGSGPRGVGAAMAVSEHGEVVGSVSGGCVEGAVVAESLEVIRAGESRRVSFGYSDDDAFAVGLTCGGTIHLFLQPLDWSEQRGIADPAVFDVWIAELGAGRPVALASVLEGPSAGATLVVQEHGPHRGTFGRVELDRVTLRDVSGSLQAGVSGVRRYGSRGETGEQEFEIFVDTFAPPPRMFIFGAVDFAAALSRVAKVLGYDVTVCDAREAFATERRFPAADRVVVEWPHRYLRDLERPPGPRDAICILTHDHKFDVPVIAAAVRTDVAYIGAMGSRRTCEERLERLRAEGLADEELERVHAPIGLDLGGRTPEETAVAIVGEIIAERHGRSSVPLRRTTGPIH